jgi:hypothetical protein
MRPRKAQLNSCPAPGLAGEPKLFQPSESASKNLMAVKKIKKSGHVWYDLKRKISIRLHSVECQL